MCQKRGMHPFQWDHTAAIKCWWAAGTNKCISRFPNEELGHSVWFHSGAKNHRVCCWYAWFLAPRPSIFIFSFLSLSLSWENCLHHNFCTVAMRKRRYSSYWIIFRWKLLDNQFHLARNMENQQFHHKVQYLRLLEDFEICQKSRRIFFHFCWMIRQ